MKILKKLSLFIIILVLSFFSIKPFFNAGFFPIHDSTQVQRVFVMTKSLSDGMFPVRWVADLGYGYGYPIFNFYAPFAYYLGAGIDLLGFDSLIATKLMMVIGILASGFFMYLFAREFWGEMGGLVSGLFYLYAPYHALDIYVRGDVAEFFGYAFIPLSFLGIYKVYQVLQGKNEKYLWNWMGVGSVGFALVILSHNLTAMMVTPFIFVFSLILYVSLRMKNKIHKPYFIFLAPLFGIGISAFYWFPVFPELKYTDVLSVVGGGSDFRDHFVCLHQLWDSQWGFAGSAPGCIDGMSFKIGKLHILFSLIALSAIYFLRKKKTKLSMLTFFVASLLFSVFLTHDSSRIIWEMIPQMAFFQFPWRFLLMISFFTSFLAGTIFYLLETKKKNFALVVLASLTIIGLIYSNAKLFTPQEYLNLAAADFINTRELRFETSKISDEYMPRGFFRPTLETLVPGQRFVASHGVEILQVKESSRLIKAEVFVKDRSSLYVNLAYFPTWHVFIDGKQEYFKYDIQGLIIDVPKGKHFIEIRYWQTDIQKIANIISLAFVLVAIIGIITHRKKTKNAK